MGRFLNGLGGYLNNWVFLRFLNGLGGFLNGLGEFNIKYIKYIEYIEYLSKDNTLKLLPINGGGGGSRTQKMAMITGGY